jgi:hypothetical protein
MEKDSIVEPLNGKILLALNLNLKELLLRDSILKEREEEHQVHLESTSDCTIPFNPMSHGPSSVTKELKESNHTLLYHPRPIRLNEVASSFKRRLDSLTENSKNFEDEIFL